MQLSTQFARSPTLMEQKYLNKCGSLELEESLGICMSRFYVMNASHMEFISLEYIHSSEMIFYFRHIIITKIFKFLHKYRF